MSMMNTAAPALACVYKRYTAPLRYFLSLSGMFSSISSNGAL
jgi:hypothetical protein